MPNNCLSCRRNFYEEEMANRYLYVVKLITPDGTVIDEKASNTIAGYLSFVEEVRKKRVLYPECYLSYNRINEEDL